MIRLLVISCLLAPQVLLAQTTSEFSIKIFGGTDTQPPTVPSIIAVTPVATTQINLGWSTSTDNFVLGGYVVLRDGTAIATTTNLSLVDTGLTASTTYSYQVRAFDVTFNYSSSSAAVATTTPAIIIPEVTATTTTTSGTKVRAVSESIQTTTSSREASIYVTTTAPVRLTVRYGTTTDYDTAVVVGEVFTTDHTVILENLAPQTTYWFEVSALGVRGQVYVIGSGSITTDTESETIVPNVSQLQIIQQNNDVILEYVIPQQTVASDPYWVRVVSNRFWYPGGVTDGVVVYEGFATGILDVDAFTAGSPLYYTVFVFDASGNTSSGALARIFDQRENKPSRATTDDVPQETDSVATGTVTTATPVHSIPGISIEQLDTREQIIQGQVSLVTNHPFIISVPSAAVPDSVTQMIVSLVQAEDGTIVRSYQLRLTNDQTYYVASVPGLHQVGVYHVTVTGYDPVRQVRSETMLLLDVTSADIPMIQLDSDIQSYWLMVGILATLGLLAVSLVFWFLIVRRHKE